MRPASIVISLAAAAKLRRSSGSAVRRQNPAVVWACWATSSMRSWAATVWYMRR
jgi:hypothetical protein